MPNPWWHGLIEWTYFIKQSLRHLFRPNYTCRKRTYFSITMGEEGRKISVVSNLVEFFCKTALQLGILVPFLGPASQITHFPPWNCSLAGLRGRSFCREVSLGGVTRQGCLLCSCLGPRQWGKSFLWALILFYLPGDGNPTLMLCWVPVSSWKKASSKLNWDIV